MPVKLHNPSVSSPRNPLLAKTSLIPTFVTDWVDVATILSKHIYRAAVYLATNIQTAAKARGRITGFGTDRADQSVERRSSGALSDLESSDLVSDLTGSTLGLSSCGASTRADISTEPVRTGGRSERGRARANSIWAAP